MNNQPAFAEDMSRRRMAWELLSRPAETSMINSILRFVLAPTLLMLSGLVAACAAEMDGQPATEAKSQALLPPDDDPPRCPIDLGLGAWDYTFEGTLARMGCQGKEQGAPAHNGWAWFTTYCPFSTSPVDGSCPNNLAGWKTIYSLSELVDCWRGHAPEKPLSVGSLASDCNLSLWGDAVAWDPNCVGGGCATWEWHRR